MTGLTVLLLLKVAEPQGRAVTERAVSGLGRGQKPTGPERPARQQQTSERKESHVPGEEGGHVYYGRRGIEMQAEEEQGNPPSAAFCHCMACTWWGEWLFAMAENLLRAK